MYAASTQQQTLSKMKGEDWHQSLPSYFPAHKPYGTRAFIHVNTYIIEVTP